MLPVALLFAGLAAVLLAPRARRTAWGRGIPAWAGLALFVPATAVGVTLLAVNASPDEPQKTPPTPPANPTTPGPPSSAGSARGPLQPGEHAPPVAAGGWVNGGPPSPGSALTVVDFWASWCPFCKQTAPDLAALHAKYAPRGVAFVGLSTMPRVSVEAYVKQNAVPYPNGYDVPRETLAAFGAANPGGPPMPGYEVAPTLYLLGPDGTVKWTDEAGRFRHREAKAIAKELDAAIAKELDALPR